MPLFYPLKVQKKATFSDGFLKSVISKKNTRLRKRENGCFGTTQPPVYKQKLRNLSMVCFYFF